MGIHECCLVLHLFGVEDDDVRLEALPEKAPIPDAKALGRCGSHLPHRLLEGDDAFPDVVAYHPGEGAVEPRVGLPPAQDPTGGDGAPVRAHHPVGVPHHSADVLLGHSEGDHGDLGVLGQEQVEDGLRGLLALQLGDLGDPLPLVLGVVLGRRDHDGAPITVDAAGVLLYPLPYLRVLEALQEPVVPPLLSPVGHVGRQARARGDVGVLVEGDVDTLPPALANQPQ